MSLCEQVIFTSVGQSLSYSDVNLPSLCVPLLLYCRLIKLRELREVNRDTFAIQIGGFDQHFSLKSGLTNLFSEINGALVGFRTALQAETLDDGSTLWDHVTVVMESEFGRTITPNANGGTGECYRLEYSKKFVVTFCCCSGSQPVPSLRLDHGWGGNHMVMGGKIKGGRVLGSHPTTYNRSDLHNTGRGAWIPTTSLEAPWVSTEGCFFRLYLTCQ